MSISQRIRDEERKRRGEEEEKQRRIEHLIASNPVRLKSRKLIPIIYPILSEFAGSVNFLLIDDEIRYTGLSQLSCPLKIYTLWTKRKTGWFSYSKGSFLFSVGIGSIRVDYYGETVSAIPISVCIRNRSHEQTIYEEYNFDTIPEGDHLIRAWFTDVLYNIYTRVKYINVLP